MSDIDKLILGENATAGIYDDTEIPKEPKIKFRIEFDGAQRNIVDSLIKIIKRIGDTPEDENRTEKNKDNYLEAIELLIATKQNFLKGNMYMFMTSGFTEDNLISFYDPDQKAVVQLPIKEIEFTFEGQDEALEIPEEEVNKLVDWLSEEQRAIEANKDVPKAKLPTADDIRAARARLKKLGIG